MKDWRDNLLPRVPGYRDRVVHVSLAPDEGGLNLSMPPEKIERLAARGRFAARKLGERFADPAPDAPMGWDNHRWVRFRSTMAVLEEKLRAMSQAFRGEAEMGRPYRDLAFRAPGEPPASYGRWRSAADREACLAWTERLLSDPFLRGEATFGDGAPNPEPELRIVPKI